MYLFCREIYNSYCRIAGNLRRKLKEFRCFVLINEMFLYQINFFVVDTSEQCTKVFSFFHQSVRKFSAPRIIRATTCIQYIYCVHVSKGPPLDVSLYLPSPGGPGSGKGRIVASLRSMFGMKLISTESIVLKYLPKKVQHVMTISSTDVIIKLLYRFLKSIRMRKIGLGIYK